MTGMFYWIESVYEATEGGSKSKYTDELAKFVEDGTIWKEQVL